MKKIISLILFVAAVAISGKAQSATSPLTAGMVSPDICAVDTLGNKHSLSEFKGNYVLLDVWATWCGPCRREIPHLKTLEERLAGKKLVVIGLSCDKDIEAWKNMVREGKTSGIPYHINVADDFMKLYEVKTIPRFILLDPEGKIVEPVFTKPSDPATAEYLVKLLGA